MKAGLVYHYPDRKPVPRRPRSIQGLLLFWQLTVEKIEDGYTLADLIELLRNLRRIHVLSPMLACDLVAVLEEAAVGPLPRSGDGASVHQLRVTNRLEPVNYVPHPEDSDDWLPHTRPEGGLGKRHGFWTGPYRIYRDLVAWGEGDDGLPGETGYPVELAGVRRLLDLPLRYIPDAVFSESLRHDGGFTTAISITFGEFVFAVFRTVGRFGTEEERREMMESMEPDPNDDDDGEWLDLEDLQGK